MSAQADLQKALEFAKRIVYVKPQPRKKLKRKEWKEARKEFYKNLPIFRASHRFARISARKARLVIDMIRGKHVNEAMLILENCPKRGAYFIRKVLKSAIANAEDRATTHKIDVDVDNLYIIEARVDEGPMLKRWMPRARGRATPIHKKMSHIIISVADPLMVQEYIQELEEKEDLPFVLPLLNKKKVQKKEE